MKKYASIKGYLERFQLFKLGKLKVRWHKLLSSDGTPYLHNHPFSYLSIILKGNYVEQRLKDDKIIEKRYSVGSIIIRKSSDYHRIKEVNDCRTLFFAWDSKIKWNLKKSDFIRKDDFVIPKDKGIYLRKIDDKELYCKFDEYWFIGSKSLVKAINETRVSIYQTQLWENCVYKID